jgi:ankyrin repeat protein
LHVAARTGQVAVLRDLARHGADLNALNRVGQTPLEVALTHGRTQAAMAIVDLGGRFDAQSTLAALVRAGTLDRDTLDFLLRAGARLDRVDDAGDAPLHLAIRADHLEVVRRLILAGADVNQPDGAGLLPLQVARASVAGPDARFIQSILERNGARPEATD